MSAALFILLLAATPLSILLVASVWPGQPWSTRSVPAEAVKVGAIVGFTTWVMPPLGILAALSAGWWWVKGFELKAGAYLWPTAAMVLLLGLQAPDWALQAALYGALALGIVESVIAVMQAFRVPILLVMSPYGTPEIIGTIGHRTGIGIYLAILIPLSFLTPAPWFFIPVYLVGIALARSVVSWAAAVAGFLWVMPWLWPLGLVALVGGAAHRFIGWKDRQWRICGDTFKARLKVWTIALHYARKWPYCLIGHGPDAFHRDALGWTARYGLAEHYREAHNDYVEFLYEYGAIGACAGVGFIALLMPHLHARDPLTGALVAYGLAALGNFPSRIAPILGLGCLVAVLLLR